MRSPGSQRGHRTRSWKNAVLALSGETDDTTAAMLLCPECADEERLGEYEEGEAG
jgi:hypothetical protein